MWEVLRESCALLVWEVLRESCTLLVWEVLRESCTLLVWEVLRESCTLLVWEVLRESCLLVCWDLCVNGPHWHVGMQHACHWLACAPRLLMKKEERRVVFRSIRWSLIITRTAVLGVCVL